MTHLGSGAWGTFREAVAELANSKSDPEEQEQALYRTLRIALSDLGHVNFFVEGSRRWHVLRPALVALAEPIEHLFVGGRTRSLVDRLTAAAMAVGAAVTVDESFPGCRACTSSEIPVPFGRQREIGIEYFRLPPPSFYAAAAHQEHDGGGPTS